MTDSLYDFRAYLFKCHVAQLLSPLFTSFAYLARFRQAYLLKTGCAAANTPAAGAGQPPNGSAAPPLQLSVILS